MLRRKFKFKIISAEKLGAGIDSAADSESSSVAPAAPTSVSLARQSPPMAVKDEMIFLLHTAAEIEHSLMVQYLYSAFSLPNTLPHRDWFSDLLAIATEEMGHLMAVQNMLIALGSPINFEREDYSFNEFYPFKFKLEPFSVESMAKYVLAEMPDQSEIPSSLGFDPVELANDAGVGNGEINRVGALFNLLESLAESLSSSDLYSDSALFQADPDKWKASSHDLVLEKVTSVRGTGGLVELIKAIGEQGEGADAPQAGEESHFLRFFVLYKAAKQRLADEGPDSLANAVPVNPTVLDSTSLGYLSHADSRAWGDVLNHRFRWLFASLSHYLSSDNVDERNTLVKWCFKEMGHLSMIATALGELPQHEPIQVDSHGRPRIAGAPFELPYTLSLPSRAIDRWRHQKLLVTISLEQLARTTSNDVLVSILKSNDEERLALIETKI